MSFSKSSYLPGVWLDDNTVLWAHCARRDATLRLAHINLNGCLGNNDGAFDLSGRNFAASAKAIHLEGSCLSADLRAVNGDWWHNTIDLDDFIENEDGELVFNLVAGIQLDRRHLRLSADTPRRQLDAGDRRESAAHDRTSGSTNKQDKSTPAPRHRDTTPTRYRCNVCKDWPNGITFKEVALPIRIRTKDLLSDKRWEHCQSCLLAGRILNELVPQLVGSRSLKDSWLELSHRLPDRITAPSFEVFLSVPHAEAEAVRYFIHTRPGDENLSDAFERVLSLQSLRGESTSHQALDVARTWLEDCVTKHTECPKAQQGTLPARVLDLGLSTDDPVKLKSTAGSVQDTYACLSHCWGKTQTLMLIQSNYDELHTQIPAHLLQETYSDAIRLCRSLGIRYLWIDTLCIIQDSKQDWETESGKMCYYYGQCFLCIAATSAADHDGGCRVRSVPTLNHQGVGHDGLPYSVCVRPEIPHIQHTSDIPRHFPLLTRAWVYQERKLSPRVLHVTNMELFFECSTATSCECSPGNDTGIHARNWTKTWDGVYARAVSAEKPFPAEAEWRIFVHAYSTLDLTKASDRLPALSGMAALTRQWRERHSVSTGRYLAGCWEGTLINDLAWGVGYIGVSLAGHQGSEHYEIACGLNMWAARDGKAGPRMARPQNFVAPSWSWAGVLDQVKYAPFGFAEAGALVQVMDAGVELATTDEYGQVKGGFIKVQAKLRPSRWTSKTTSGIQYNFLVDVESARAWKWPEWMVKDKDTIWWRDFADGEHWKLKAEELLYLMPLVRRKTYGPGESGALELTTETMFLVLRMVQDSNGSLESPDRYERVGCTLHSEMSGMPDFDGVPERTIVLV